MELQKLQKSLQNISAAVESKIATPRERYISPEERQQNIDELRLI